MTNRSNQPVTTIENNYGERKVANFVRILLILFAVVVSISYLVFSWRKYEEAASSEAITLAKSLVTLLQSEQVEKLSGKSNDVNKQEYIIIKRNLNQLVQSTNPIQFAYLMGIVDSQIVFLVDSEPSDSLDYSPPGQVYYEDDKALYNVFNTGEAAIYGPTTDRWGTWISALVPVRNAITQETIAVFGIDYAATDWNFNLRKQMIPDILIVLFFQLFIFSLIRAESHYIKLKKTSDQLAFDEALYHSVFDQIPIGIAIVNDKRFLSQQEYGNLNMNPTFQNILGRTRDELQDIKWTDITHPDDLQNDLEKFKQFQERKIEGYSLQKRFQKPDGSYVWTFMKITHFLDEHIEKEMHLCLLEDISLVKQTNDSLMESERSKAMLLSNLPGMAYRCNFDRAWTMKFVSDGCYDLTGYSAQSLIGNKDISFNDIIATEYRDLLWDRWCYILQKKLPFRFEYEIVTSSGERKWVLEIAKGVYDESGEVEALEGIILDISDRKKAEDLLVYSYEHDSITGLLNRESLDKTLRGDHEKNLGCKRALIIINLSTVQSLSAAYGYYYTQELIIKIVKKLDLLSNEKSILYKTYENRFVYYLKDYSCKENLAIFTRKVAEVLESILSVERIGAGIGVLEINPNDAFDLNVISKKALTVSELAIGTEEREIGVCFFDDTVEKFIERETYIKRELDEVASSDENAGLYLQFQPIVDIKTRGICGFEALARLRTSNLEQISPVEFIPIAEKTKLIVPIGWKIARLAFLFLKRINNAGFCDISMAINVSAIQLLKRHFIEDLQHLIIETEVNPQDIVIEITESVFVSGFERINKIFDQLRAVGIKVAIDDFGTEYSSLARERELKVDCIKIDKSFIDRLLQVPYEYAITSDIISMAHKLGHCTVAEGVEYKEQEQYLLENGCDKIQGYLISKPLDADAAISFLGSTVIAGIV